MAEVKWIKLDVDMFSNPKIKRLRRLPDGNNVLLIWIMLLTMAGKCNASGMIFITQNILYTPEDLADELGFSVDTVKLALKSLEEMGMITTSEGLEITNWHEHQSGDSLDKIKEQNRIRQQNHRAKQKELQDMSRDSNVTNNVKRSYSNSISNSISYSFNNNTNINNLIYILENTNNEYIEYINNNSLLKETVMNWMEYKDEKKPKSSNHYAETSINSLLKKIVKGCKEHGDDVVDKVIQDSIANNYQGIVWDWLQKDTKTSFTVPKPLKSYQNSDGSIDWSKV